MPERINSTVTELFERISSCDAIVAFTGAGISTECGVPDFRSPDSAWKRNAPIPFADFLSHEESRVEAWRRKFAMDDLYADAKPGRGHEALARLSREGKLHAVITQNIDGLHQASGIDPADIIELHGNGSHARCLSCNTRYELGPIRAQIEEGEGAPICACGGLVKSATISFGQSMPKEEMVRAQAAVQACDMFLVIGSSLVVRPAASFPVLAKQAGAQLIILNREATPLDELADLVVQEDIGSVLAGVSSTGLTQGLGENPRKRAL